MSTFKFLHAADLHLDSPLLGLAGKSPDFAAKVESASRQAFDALVALAIEEGCRFVVLAGDVFDGDLRNFQTGLFFLAGMRRLREADIKVFLIAGNHDAENRFAAKLAYSENVHLFPHRKADWVRLDDVGAVVHGRSFGNRAMTENLARDYPAPHDGHFNIGVLHTACQGSEGEHAVYAPCTVEQLINHGYDYWALGHVHGRLVLNEHPHIVYPGNLQGRHARETGPKGATLVEVANGRVVRCEHRDLDVIRWAGETVDVAAVADRGILLARLQEALAGIREAAGERPVALRLRLTGETPLHAGLLLDGALRQDIEFVLATLSPDLWLEKLEIRTRMPAVAPALDPSVAGQLESELRILCEGDAIGRLLDSCLAEIRAKMPAGARADAFFEQLRREMPARGIDLALSLLHDGARGSGSDPAGEELGSGDAH